MQDETRRAELDSFHTVLTDISHGATTNDVREFMIDAYVHGYEIATAALREYLARQTRALQSHNTVLRSAPRGW